MNLSFQRKNSPTLLSLSFDGSKLEGVLLRRSNGSAEVVKTFSATLTLDLLNNEAELVGREIRNHLDAAGIRERRCAVCIPLKWALTLATPLPEMPEEDVAEFVQIEAERGFSLDPESLLITRSRQGANVTQVAVPLNHLTRLEEALAAAKLRPVSFSIGITALQPVGPDTAGGTLTLYVGEEAVDLQVTSGGGIIALRSLAGVVEAEGGKKEIDGDFIAREIRITLGQLPADVQENVRHLRVYGQGDLARQLVEELRSSASAMGLGVEQVTAYGLGDLGVQLAAGTQVSAPLSLAGRRLAGRNASLEFLPPKVSAWQQFSARYSSRKLVLAGATAGAVALVVAGAFGIQQYQLSSLDSQRAAIQGTVDDLTETQKQIRRFRPWFDNSYTGLSILKNITEAFPQDGSVTAKTLEIRNLSAVVCSGTTRDLTALSQTQERLQKINGFKDVKIESVRGDRPRQFVLSWRWEKGGNNREN